MNTPEFYRFYQENIHKIHPNKQLKHIIFEGEYIHGIYDNFEECWKDWYKLITQSTNKVMNRNNKSIGNDVDISSARSLALLSLPIENVILNIDRGPNIVHLVIEIIDEDNEKSIALYTTVPEKYENKRYEIEEYIYNSY